MFYTLKDLYYTHFYKTITTMIGSGRERVQNIILRHIDRDLDGVFHTLHRFRSYRLYISPTKVTIEQMNAVEDAFLRIADQNRQGPSMTLGQTIVFLRALYHTRLVHAKVIAYMEDALNVHALLRTAFGLDR